METSISEAIQKTYRLGEPDRYQVTSFTSSKNTSRFVLKVEIIRKGRIIGNQCESWLHRNILGSQSRKVRICTAEALKLQLSQHEVSDLRAANCAIILQGLGNIPANMLD